MGEVELAGGREGDSLEARSGKKGKESARVVNGLRKSSGKRVDRDGKADKLVAAILSVL